MYTFIFGILLVQKLFRKIPQKVPFLTPPLAFDLEKSLFPLLASPAAKIGPGWVNTTELLRKIPRLSKRKMEILFHNFCCLPIYPAYHQKRYSYELWPLYSNGVLE